MLTDHSWYHCAWGTKDCSPFLFPGNRYEIITHIRVKAGINGLYIDILNGCSEHLHCIIMLRGKQSLPKTMKQIRCESMFWMTSKKLIDSNTKWADEFYASRLSDPLLNKARDYIRDQEIHHREKTWLQEQRELLELNGFSEYR